jgi:uncharacterized protein (TIGR04255 family)
MFDFLPVVEVQSLADSPLQQVIAQVRFGSQSVLGTQGGAGAVHDSLSDMYPRLLTEQQQVVTMTPSGTTLVSVPQYRITNLEGSWSVVVGTEQLTVETSKYSTWTELRTRLEAALKAVGDVVQLRVRERAGLRYINHIKSDNGSFNRRVLPELLGPAGYEDWRGSLTSFLSQITAMDEDGQMILRVGVPTQEPGAPVFLLDIDCFNEQPREFNLKETLEYFDQLNDASYRCFCWCVPSEYRHQLSKTTT